MKTTPTAVGMRLVASMTATANGVQMSCEVREDAGRYYLFVDGELVHRDTGSIVAPIEQMAHTIDRRFPFRERFGLLARCETRSFSIAYGTAKQELSGGAGGPAIPCVEEAMETYRDDTLDDALRHAVDTLKRCCR